MMSPLSRLVRFSFPALALLLLTVVGVGCEADPSDKDIVRISLAEVRSLREGKDATRVMFVDPRSPDDYAAGHIPGAHNYGINSERAKSGGGLNPVFRGYKHIIVYGDDPSSGPAIAMTKRLMIMRADNVRLYSGGLLEWRRAGLPVEKGTPAAASNEKTNDASSK